MRIARVRRTAAWACAAGAVIAAGCGSARALRVASVDELVRGAAGRRAPSSAALPAAIYAPARADDLAAALDAQAPGWLARSRVPSLAVAYVADGALQWTRVYGVQAPRVPATPRTLYNVASLTKPVFAELVVRLAAAGRLSLDEPLAPTWVDPDVAGDPRVDALTLRLLLSQRSGFPNWRRETGGVLRFRTAPGTTYGYSGEGYEYARHFVERKLGASLDALARQYVFGPFGMTDAAFTAQPGFAGRVARPQGADGRFSAPAFSTHGSAADLLHATVGDYAAFLVGVMHRTGLSTPYAHQGDSLHVLDPSTLAGCDPAVAGRCPDSAGYGLGWALMRYRPSPGYAGETVVWHTGIDAGDRAMVVYFPERRDGVVMFANGADGFQPMIDVGALLFRGTAFADYLRAGRR